MRGPVASKFLRIRRADPFNRDGSGKPGLLRALRNEPGLEASPARGKMNSEFGRRRLRKNPDGPVDVADAQPSFGRAGGRGAIAGLQDLFPGLRWPTEGPERVFPRALRFDHPNLPPAPAVRIMGVKDRRILAVRPITMSL